MAKQHQSSDLGPILVDAVYPLEIFKRLSGQSVWGLRQAKRRGLRVRTCGRRSYVIGRDWAEYLANHG